MKIAVTAKDGSLDGEVDERFGRAKCFLVIDTEDDSVQAVDNQTNMAAPQGAGIQSAQKVCELGVQAILTGHCGPKAFSTLQAGGIAIYTGASGKVSEVLEAFKAGKMEPSDGADVDGHWL